MEPRLAYLDAYLELPGEILERARGLNRLICIAGGGSIDFGTGRVPHLTLFMGLFPENEIQGVRRELQAVASDTAPVRIVLGEVEAAKDGYVFWNVAADPPLRRLHERVVFALNPLRRGAVRDKFIDDIDRFGMEERVNIMNYGFPWVLDQFRPHVTVGRFDGGFPAADTNLPDRLDADGTALRLSLGSVGEHGVVMETSDAFSLSGTA